MKIIVLIIPKITIVKYSDYEWTRQLHSDFNFTWGEMK